ncbi:hypothetical protein [Pseudomonas syringae group genomosp. 3]|uniref:Uncharacterized protein n=1 Tax=Pseudomonas syringae pv. primulae TaxID=251707 RepID=A0A3M5TMN4_9PSED|nr:hypothetical protein [Pseudomonas syringae group genomosp. 3]RMO70610.1 hypothetical protein ALQ36_01741 [Pseudomonas syringae pv. primulae]RMU34819.1 hypothetical protein ALP30_00178 [Pseudomonas syringae pv. primulae]
MTKLKSDASASSIPAVNSPPVLSAFVDKVFTSRTLVLPSGKTLSVVGGVVSVSADDVEALGCLKAHNEFETLE